MNHDAREAILGGVLRRKMARQVPVPVYFDGVTYELHSPDLPAAAEIGQLAGGDRVKMAAIIVERFLRLYGVPVLEAGDAVILLKDDPNGLVATCMPIIDKMLSTTAIHVPTKPSGPPVPTGEPHGWHAAIDLNIEINSGNCRRCEVPVYVGCKHRDARPVYRCANPCSNFVRTQGEFCAMHVQENS